LTVPVIVRDPAGALRAAGIRAIWRSAYREVETRRGEHLAQGGGDRQLFGVKADAQGQIGLFGVVEKRVFAALLDARYGFRKGYVGELYVDRRLLRLAMCNRCPFADEQQ